MATQKAKSIKRENREASIDAQELLVEILNDSPHLVSLNGTEWEVRSLRFGTQYLIAEEVVKISDDLSPTEERKLIRMLMESMNNLSLPLFWQF